LALHFLLDIDGENRLVLTTFSREEIGDIVTYSKCL
jgi:hypothetical protein